MILKKKPYCAILKIIEIESECLLRGTLEINDNLTFVYVTYGFFRLRMRGFAACLCRIKPWTTCNTSNHVGDR